MREEEEACVSRVAAVCFTGVVVGDAKRSMRGEVSFSSLLITVFLSVHSPPTDTTYPLGLPVAAAGRSAAEIGVRGVVWPRVWASDKLSSLGVARARA